MNAMDYHIAQQVAQRIVKIPAGKGFVMAMQMKLRAQHQDKIDAGIMSRKSGAENSTNPAHYKGFRNDPNYGDGIPYKGYWIGEDDNEPFSYCHEDFDGAPDSYDNRCGHGKTVEDCMEQIDEAGEE